MAVKNWIDNIIIRSEIEEKIDNAKSALKELPKIIQRSVDWWKVNMYDKKIKRCKKFNRRDNWGLNLIVDWFESVAGFFNLNPLVYVHIKSCLDHCRKQGLTKDVEYFGNYHEEGYTYLTVEGGNRSDATYLLWDMFEWLRGRMLNIIIIRGVDRETMHEIYVRVSKGNTPNRQETRTGIYGYLSDKVRYIAEKYVHIFNRLGLNIERMKEDELMARTYIYTKSQTLGNSLDDRIDQEYRAKKPSDIRQWLSNMSLLSKFFKKYNKLGENRQFDVGFYYVVLFVLDWMRRDNIKILKWVLFVNDFIKTFSLLMIDETVLYNSPKHQYTFSDMVRHKADDRVRKTIIDIFKAEIYSYCDKGICCESTPRTDHDYYDRVRLYKYLDRVPMLRINGEINGEWYDPYNKNNQYRKEPLSFNESTDSRISHIDHMKSLSRNKNVDVIENKEFTTPAYNRWKKEREEETVKETIKQREEECQVA